MPEAAAGSVAQVLWIAGIGLAVLQAALVIVFWSRAWPAAGAGNA